MIDPMQPNLSLTLIAGPGDTPPETRNVTGYEFVIGRGQKADWMLPDPEHNVLSRRHCMVSVSDDGWLVTDLSGNGTFLNSEREAIGLEKSRRLRDGDRLRVGAYQFQARIIEAQSTAAPAADADDWPSFVRDRPPVEPPPEWHAAPPPSRPAANPFADDSWSAAPEPPVYQPPPQAVAPRAAPPQAAPPVAGGNPFLDDSPPQRAPPPPQAPPPPLPPAPVAQPRGSNPFSEPEDVAAPTAGPASSPVAAPPCPATQPSAPSLAPLASPSAASPLSPEGAASSPPSGPPAPAPPSVASPPPGPPPSAPPFVATPAPAAVAPGPGDAQLLAAFLAGAGMQDVEPKDPEKAMRALGAAFRAMVVGLREVVRTRRQVRSGFRIEQTQWTENPLKASASDDDALLALLGGARRTTMPPAKAVAEVLREIALHEMATTAAMQSAIRSLLAALSPDTVREIAEQGGGLALLPAMRKARAWEGYEALYAKTIERLDDDFDSVFGKAFARAYEKVVAGDT